MAIGIIRFNFTTSAEHTPDSLKQLILTRLAGSTIDVAPNTIAVHIDSGIPPDEQAPLLPGFRQIRGSIRHRS